MLEKSRDEGVWEVLVSGAHRIVSGHQGQSTLSIFPSLKQIPRRVRFLGHIWPFTLFLAKGEQGILTDNQSGCQPGWYLGVSLGKMPGLR